jgi:hypothetical protein
MMKDNVARLIEARTRLAQQAPDPTPVIAGSLMTRMIRCNKPGCRYCEKGKGKGHGPIWILSVNTGQGRVRQIPVPAHLKQDVEAGVRRYADMQKWLKQISRLSVELLEERKKR